MQTENTLNLGNVYSQSEPTTKMVVENEVYALRYVSLPDTREQQQGVNWQADVPKILSHQQKHFKPWT